MALLPDSIGSSGGNGLLPDWLLQALQGAQAQAGVQQPYNAMGGPFAQPQGAPPAADSSVAPSDAAAFAAYKQRLAREFPNAQQPQQAPPLPPPIAVAAAPQSPPPQAAMAQAPVPQATAPGGLPATLPGAGANFGGNLGAGLMGFLNSSGPLPALGNLISGLATGQRSDPRGMALESQAAAYKAIKAAGGTEAQAIAGATNPDVFKAMAPELFGAPKVVKTGTDILGRDIFKLQQGSKFSDIPGQGGGGGAAGGTTLDESKPLYGQLPKAQQGVVDSMLDGRIAPPTAMALKTPYWNNLLAAADEKAKALGQPGFDATTWSQKKRAADDLAPQGKSGQQISALDAVQGHIKKFSDAVEALDNSDWPAINWLNNTIATNTALNPARAQKLQAVLDARKAVVDEMSRAYKAGHVSDTEIREWSALISGQGQKTAQRQALADFTELLNTKRGQIIGQYAGLGVPFKGANAQQNEEVTKLVHDRNMGVGAAPAGPTAPSAAGAIPSIGQRRTGQTYQTPKGPMIWRGTGWEPASNANTL